MIISLLFLSSKQIETYKEEKSNQRATLSEYREFNKYSEGNTIGGQDVVSAIMHYRGVPIIEVSGAHCTETFDTDTRSSHYTQNYLMNAIPAEIMYNTEIEYDDNEQISKLVFTER